MAIIAWGLNKANPRDHIEQAWMSGTRSRCSTYSSPTAFRNELEPIWSF